MECRGHVLEYQARDPVRPRSFMAWGAAESFLQNDWADASGDHRDSMLLAGCNVAEPREWCFLWECGVRRKGLRFKLLYLCDDLLWVRDEAARGGVSYDREVCGERLRILLLRCSLENGLQDHLRFCYKHAKEGFSIF